jgi:uncharacterized cupredoxin-like copper-binding protein
MRIRRPTLLVVAIGLVAAACSGGGAADVSATLRDDGITLSKDIVDAGDVALEGTNEGTTTHELEVFSVPEGVDANALPVEGDAVPADEMLEIVDEVEDIAPGTSASLSLALDPGTYVVLCNLPGHYANGMHATFTAE